MVAKWLLALAASVLKVDGRNWPRGMERDWSSPTPETIVDCPLDITDETGQMYSLHHYGYWTPEGDLMSESCNDMDRKRCADECSVDRDCAAFSVTNGCGFCFLYWGKPDEYGPTANNTEIHVDPNECAYIRSPPAQAGHLRALPYPARQNRAIAPLDERRRHPGQPRRRRSQPPRRRAAPRRRRSPVPPRRRTPTPPRRRAPAPTPGPPLPPSPPAPPGPPTTCWGFYAIPENHADYYHLDPCWGGAHITLAGYYDYPEEQTGSIPSYKDIWDIPRKISFKGKTPWRVNSNVNAYLLGKEVDQRSAHDRHLEFGSHANPSITLFQAAKKLQTMGVQRILPANSIGPHVTFDSCGCWDTCPNHWEKHWMDSDTKWFIMPVSLPGDCKTSLGETANSSIGGADACYKLEDGQEGRCTRKYNVQWHTSHLSDAITPPVQGEEGYYESEVVIV